MSRLSKAQIPLFKAEARRLREKGLSYPAIGRLLGKDHTTIMYHLKEEWGATKREQMRFYNYVTVCVPEETGAE